LRARLLARLAEELIFSPAEDRRQTLAREAIALARAAEDPPTLAYVLRAAHWALWNPDNSAERLELAEEIDKLGAVHEAAAIEAQPLCVWDMIESGDLDAARAELRLCSRDATEAPHPYLVWAVGVSQTLVDITEGRLLEAEALAQQTLQAALQAQNQNAPLVFAFHGAAIHQNQGRLPEAERLLQGALETHPVLAPCLHALLSHLYAEMGQPKEARRYFDLAESARSTYPRNFTWLLYHAALAEASVLIEGAPQARALHDALLPFADRIAVATPLLSLGPVAFHLGLLSAALGNPDEALQQLDQAHAIADRLGMRLTRARIRLAHAELLTKQAGAEHEERAIELLDMMLATANELSLAALAEKARSLRKRLRPEEEMAPPELSQAAHTAATLATLPPGAAQTAATQATMAPRGNAPAPVGQRSDLGIGFVLANSYKLLDQIGKGGMGAVWSAQHLRLRGKRVAIKVLLEQASGIPEGYARFRHEAEIASRLGHPNIIEVLDFNELDDGTPYMVMEFLNGESLGRRMKVGAMPIDAVVPVVRQIGSALAAAHREGVVHRDLKPENIYLCPTGFGGGEHVKVLDFGISKMRDSDTIRTQVDVLIGTPRYMSPEQAMGRNDQIDGRTDIFALGAIVYEMLTHRAAFSGDSLAQILYRIVHEPPTPLEQLIHDLPPRVVEAVARALEKDAEKRFAEVGEFVLALG
jgi:tetratricopeptide (TPR) repeat protein